MLFSLTNPEIAILMMGLFLFAVLLGFPIAFTLMAMGLVLVITLIMIQRRWNISLIIEFFNYLFKTLILLWIIMF